MAVNKFGKGIYFVWKHSTSLFRLVECDQCSRKPILRIFRISKNMTFYFFEVVC